MEVLLDLLGAALLSLAALSCVYLYLLKPRERSRRARAGSVLTEEFRSLLGPLPWKYGVLVSVLEAPPHRSGRVAERLRASGVRVTVGETDPYGLAPVLVFPEDRGRALELLDVAWS